MSNKPQRSEQPRFNLETLEGRKAAWAWLQDKFGNPLVVTKDGVPFKDQDEGIRQFKAAAQRSEQAWTVREIRIDEDRNGWVTGYGLFQGDQQLATGSKSELLRVADAINAALAAERKLRREEREVAARELQHRADRIKTERQRREQAEESLRLNTLAQIESGKDEDRLHEQLSAERQLAEKAAVRAEQAQIALDAERQRADKAEAWAEDRDKLREQLLSALAAIEKHNKGLSHANKRAYEIKIDRSVLHQHDAEVRKPLVELLEWLYNNVTTEEQANRIWDALKVKDNEDDGGLSEGQTPMAGPRRLKG